MPPISLSPYLYFFGFIIPLLWLLVYSYEYASTLLDGKFLAILTNSFISSGLSAFIIILLAFFIGYTSRIYPTLLKQVSQ